MEVPIQFRERKRDTDHTYGWARCPETIQGFTTVDLGMSTYTLRRVPTSLQALHMGGLWSVRW